MRNLIVVRAGDDSLHAGWKAGSIHGNFDVFVSYYGNQEGRYRDQCDYYESIHGLKYPIIGQHLAARQGLLEKYDAFWLPDDDIRTDGANINEMFDLFHRYQLSLAQPALTPESFWHRKVVTANHGTVLRFTNFVEIMCPVFSREALERVRFTFDESPSGWGLDYVWPHLLGASVDKIAVLDRTPVTHTRPFRDGPFYDLCFKMGVRPDEDYRRMLEAYGLDPIPGIQVHGAVAEPVTGGK